MLVERDNCCGCEACIDSCRFEAIKMTEDHEGFLYPKVNVEKCVNCKQCEKSCPVINRSEIINKNNTVDSYAGYLGDKELLLSSSSGGAFIALAASIILRGGFVCGVVYSDEFDNIHYIVSNKMEDIYKMRGSKYIQSQKNGIYNKTKKLLEINKLVLFVGLPCEVAGLKAFLKEKYSNLYTCDLICQGPTSSKVLKQFLNNYKKNGPVENINTRYKKDETWGESYLKIDFKSGKKILQPFQESLWGRAFSILPRLSCYECKFKGEFRCSDITLGDYWGINNDEKAFNRNGTSVLIVNTNKGKNLLNDIKGFKVFETKTENILSGNPMYMKSNSKSINRDEFSNEFITNGLKKAVKKVYKTSLKLFVKKILRNLGI